MARKATKSRGIFEKVPGSGIWYVLYWHEGKRVRKMVGDRQAAVAYLKKVNGIKVTGSGVVPTTAQEPAQTFEEIDRKHGTVTVGELCDDWLSYIQQRAKPNKDQRVYKDQRNPALRMARIKVQFGERPASSLKPYEISNWLDSMDVKIGTKNKYKFTISGMYRHGQYREKVSNNPAKDVKTGKTGNGVIRFLKADEETRIRQVLQADIDNCPDTQPTIRKRLIHRVCEFDVSLGTGMRKGEQYKLLWSDVDFKGKEITVRDTKNGETRTVPMIKDVRNALLTIRGLGLERKDRSADQPNQSPDDVVFFVEDNHKWWGKILKRARVKNYRWHDNRHTFCSRLAQNKVSLKFIQEAAGHKSIQMTARYAHLDKTHIADAMAVLNR